MKYRNNISRRFLSAFMAVVLACGCVPVSDAWGVGAVQSAGVAGRASSVSVQSEDGEGGQGVAAGDAIAAGDESGAGAAGGAAADSDDAASQPSAAALQDAAAASSAVLANNDGEAEGAAADDPTPAAEAKPYDITVTFDGQELAEGDGQNNLTDVWTTGSKMLNVKLKRNKNVAIDPTKQYVLCMSVPDLLYFNGLPDTSINGVDAVVMLQNSKPDVESMVGDVPNGNYPLSAYSGEIRLKLNTAVNDIEIADLGLSYDPMLVGISVNAQTIVNALSVHVETADAFAGLDTYDNSSVLLERKVDSLQVKRPATNARSMKLVLSNDGFVANSVNVNNVNTGKGGTATYAVSTSGSTNQYFQQLQIEFDCPYVDIPSADGATKERHYLDFSADDSALTVENKKGSKKGYTLAEAASYDADRHVITFTFSNLVIGGHTILVYSPSFKWPSEIADQSVPAEGYKIGGATWRVTKQICYSGAQSNLYPTSTFRMTNYISFVSDMVNIGMVSSDEADESKQMAKRRIYQGLTRANRRTGALGFFDVHNDGAVDSQRLKVEFDFNSDLAASARYYVTSVILPTSTPSGGTTVHYTVINDAGVEKSGERSFGLNSTFTCSVGSLGFDSTWYIKSLWYETEFKAGVAYHQETAHLWRNRTIDGGLFFGYIEGELESQAAAKMTISSVDDTPITLDGKSSISSTERSTVANDDYSAYSIRAITVDGGTSSAITAGQTSRLSFGAMVNNEEYTGSSDKASPLFGYVNGYHVMRNPLAYVCLPEGVSIAGKSQAKISVAGVEYEAVSVKRLDDSQVDVNGIKACWWEIDYGELNIGASLSIRTNITLSTDLKMSGVVWDFSNCVAWRSKGQMMNWAAASSLSGSVWNNASSLASGNVPDTMKALGASLNNQVDTNNGKLGLTYYAYDSNMRLNISRAEAKLDVDTELLTDSETSRDLKVASADKSVNYQVTVSSTDGGYADNFSYYIPIPKQSSVLDSDVFVSQNEYDLQLKGSVGIEDLTGANAMLPFDVFYTTKEGLDSTSVSELPFGPDASTGWMSEDEGFSDFSHVTAILIATKVSAQVAENASYRFNVKLGYDNTLNDFATQAGCVVKWRSFGHYIYTRNGAPTENTYPSQDNSVKLGYVANYTDTPIEVALDTGADSNVASFGHTFDQSFKNDQTMAVKRVTPAGGTTLVSDDPSSLTGSDANSKFLVKLGLNGAAASTLAVGYKGGDALLVHGEDASLSGSIAFSRALTDTTTLRYIDVVLGNDDIDITMRIKLVRTVKAASVSGSGTVGGENFQVPVVSTNSKTIAANGSVTALYDIANFRPGNFTAQQLAWKQGGSAATFPAGTTVTMLVLGDDNTAQSWWLWRAEGSASSVDLESFKQMAGSVMFSYDKASTTATELKYQFVVSFPAGNNVEGDFSLVFEAVPKQEVDAVSSELPVKLAKRSDFSLNVDGGNVTYDYTASAGDDVRTTGKQLSLVLKPSSAVALPADARIRVGGVEYARNGAGGFIVPRGTVDSGSASLELVSGMLGAAGGSFGFDIQLMLSGADTSPMAGAEVATGAVTLSVAAGDAPSVSVTGTRVAHKSEWANGVDFSFAVCDLPEGATVTVSAYNGLTQSTPATNLLSSVGGVFDVNGGTGTYKGDTSTGKLVLNSAADAGTYRLVFEVKKGDATLLSVPYYIVVRD